MSSLDTALTMPDRISDPASESAPAKQPTPLALPPLTVSALMVTKADLIAALRIYLPHLSDIEMIDADRFLLSIAGPPAENGRS